MVSLSSRDGSKAVKKAKMNWVLIHISDISMSFYVYNIR